MCYDIYDNTCIRFIKVVFGEGLSGRNEGAGETSRRADMLFDETGRRDGEAFSPDFGHR